VIFFSHWDRLKIMIFLFSRAGSRLVQSIVALDTAKENAVGKCLQDVVKRLLLENCAVPYCSTELRNSLVRGPVLQIARVGVYVFA